MAIGVGIWATARARPFRVEVRGESMAPTLRDGEWAIAVRARRLRSGDVVVLEHPERPGFEIVKRLTAHEGGWWVEGDAPDASTDSRHFGAVAPDAVAGRVVAVYWPPRRARLVG